jgi:DNA-binding LacI/PurR family transcriptional regulator
VQRPTIADIARLAGVSKGAVSYALNGQPGVSAATRERIQEIAQAIGWNANSAARALSGSLAGAVGMVLARPARTLGVESFFMQFISGIEAELAPGRVALVVQVVEDHEAEIATYRRWWGERRIDGVIVADVRTHDTRIPLLEELGLPAVLTGGATSHHGSIARVWVDNAAPVRVALRHLHGLGHRRFGRVAGLPELEHTAMRGEAFDEWLGEHDLTGLTRYTDYSPEEGAAATRALLAEDVAPTALLYDNDVMAVAGMTACHEDGLRVPGDVSIVAWDDSVLCRIVHPGLTAMRRDIAAYGAVVARTLLDVVDGHRADARQAATPQLVVRASTAPPATT